MKVITTSANKTSLYDIVIYSTYATYFTGRKKLYIRQFLESLYFFFIGAISSSLPTANQALIKISHCSTALRGTEHLKHLKLTAVAFTSSELMAPHNLMTVLSQCKIIAFPLPKGHQILSILNI